MASDRTLIRQRRERQLAPPAQSNRIFALPPSHNEAPGVAGSAAIDSR